MHLRLLTASSIVLLLLNVCSGNDLESLIDGISPFEEITVNGSPPTADTDSISVEHDEDGTLSVLFNGEGVLSVGRSTGLSRTYAHQLLDILSSAVGSRYKLITSMKRGGRILTGRDEQKLNRIVDSIGQKMQIYIDDEPVDLSKAALVDTGVGSLALQPERHPGLIITSTDLATTIKTTGVAVKVVLTRGLSKDQVKILKDNFYGAVAARASAATGLPKPMIELAMAGRNTIVDRLSSILSPVERVVVGGIEVNLDERKKKQTAFGRVLQPLDLPQVKITWKKGDVLRVDSEDGESINVEYSQGLDSSLISSLVDGFHRTFTLRLGLITWSNKFSGSLPAQLESALDELKTKIQTRRIYVDDEVVDLKKTSVIETTDESVLYRLPDGVRLRLYFDGTVASQGNEKLSVELTPGISEAQAANIFARMNQVFSTAVGFTTNSGEALLSYESNRNLLQTLMRGIKPKEIVQIDEETVEFSNATLSNTETDYNEYKLDVFDDVVLTKLNDGSLEARGIGRTVFLSRSTGLTLGFLNRLVTAVNNVMPRKRWFYDFGFKGGRDRSQQLRDIIDEIPSLVQNHTILVDKKEIDLMKTSILGVDDISTIFTVDTSSDTKITKFVNGDVSVASQGNTAVAVKVSSGITTRDAEILVDNIKKVVGDRIKLGKKRPSNLWCSSGGIRNLLNWLIKKMSLRRTNIESYDVSLSTSRDLSESHRDYNRIYESFGTDDKENLEYSFSPSLTPELTNELVQYLAEIFEDKENIIKMVTGSFPDRKRRKIKELILETVRRSKVLTDSNLSDDEDEGKWFGKANDEELILQEQIKNDGTENPNSELHPMAPGITMQQAEQLYSNIFSAFKEKFAEITNIPLQVLELIFSLKRYIVKSYFYSAAPPKEYISINGREIRLKKSSGLDKYEGEIVTTEADGIQIIEHSDGGLEVISSEVGSIDLIKTTGLDDNQIESILRSCEYKLGIRNKIFRILPDKLASTAETSKSVETLLKSYVSDIRLKIDGNPVDTSKLQKFREQAGCSFYRFNDIADMTVKRCDDGQVSVHSEAGRNVRLRVLPGVSQRQSSYILKSLQNTIRTKSSNIKLLANFPDTLLADGRIKSLEKLLLTLLPRQDIFVNGRRIVLKPLKLDLDDDFVLERPETFNDIDIYRFTDGSIEVKSWIGGRLDVSFSSGLTTDLLIAVIEKLKKDTTQKLLPYYAIAEELLQSDASTFFTFLDRLVQARDSGLDLRLVLEILKKEIENGIQSIDMDHHFVQHVGKAAEQRQEIFIDDQPVNLGDLSVLESSDEFEVVAPDGKDYIKITRFDSGRLIVDSSREQPVSVKISAGIPAKIMPKLTKTVRTLFQKIDTETDITGGIIKKLLSYLDQLNDITTAGIVKRRKIVFNGQDIELNEDSLLEPSNETSIYERNNLTIRIEADGDTELELRESGRLELDISSGLMTNPVLSFLSNNSLELTKEFYLSLNQFETMAPVMTKVEKIVDKMMNSLKQSVFVNGRSTESETFLTVESNEDFRTVRDGGENSVIVTVYKDGRLAVDSNRSAVNVTVSGGLSPADLIRLSSNVESLFSSLNPIELFADIFDALPKNFFLLAQNMDRVLSIMNIVKF